MKRITSIVVILLILVLGVRATALAINDTPARALGLVQGLSYSGVSIPAGVDYWYKANLVAGRSYCVLMWFPSNDGSVAPPKMFVDWFLDDGVTAANTISRGDVEPRLELNEIGTTVRIVARISGTHRIRVYNASAFSEIGFIRLVETTLFSPWYFVSPDTGYDAYIEMRNNTSQNIWAIVTAYDPGGTVAGSTTVALQPNGNTVIPVTSLGVISGYGSVQIAHYGTQGAICANITTLSSITGVSFDSPFTPRTGWGSS